MDDTLKVYTNDTISDQPFPQGSPVNLTITQGVGTQQTYSNATIQDQGVPPHPIARETIGATLNTKSKKILQEFQFADSGALRIGKYTPGVSGEVDISPAGIVAKDQSGNTTIAIDGDTGDATFAGTLAANTIIGADGNVIITEDEAGHGTIEFLDGTRVAILLGWGDF